MTHIQCQNLPYVVVELFIITSARLVKLLTM